MQVFGTAQPHPLVMDLGSIDHILFPPCSLAIAVWPVWKLYSIVILFILFMGFISAVSLIG